MVTSMVQMIQNKNPQCARLFLRNWLNSVYHLPRYFRRPRLNMHGVIFRGKSKRFRTSQWLVKLQRRSSVLRISCLRKNGDGVVPKTFEKYHDPKSATKLEQHDKDGSYRMVLQGTLQWQRKPKCYAIALRKPAVITQAVSCTARRRHHQERTVTKRYYATQPRCRLLHSTTRQRTTEGKRL